MIFHFHVEIPDEILAEIVRVRHGDDADSGSSRELSGLTDDEKAQLRFHAWRCQEDESVSYADVW